jgi:hypothetical protein
MAYGDTTPELSFGSGVGAPAKSVLRLRAVPLPFKEGDKVVVRMGRGQSPIEGLVGETVQSS